MTFQKMFGGNMDPLQFCYWLQGFAEINGDSPNEAQWKAIRDHLNLVFVKKTPEYHTKPTYRDATSIGSWCQANTIVTSIC